MHSNKKNQHIRNTILYLNMYMYSTRIYYIQVKQMHFVEYLGSGVPRNMYMYSIYM